VDYATVKKADSKAIEDGDVLGNDSVCTPSTRLFARRPHEQIDPHYFTTRKLTYRPDAESGAIQASKASVSAESCILSLQ
jgi:hypothetical protein